MTSVSERLNYIPHRVVDTPFDIWYRHYKSHLINIFSFFKEALHNVLPFCEKNLDSEKSLVKFAELIYKNSSGVIK